MEFCWIARPVSRLPPALPCVVVRTEHGQSTDITTVDFGNLVWHPRIRAGSSATYRFKIPTEKPKRRS